MNDNTEKIKKYNFEITKHTIHFHENASIYSVSSTKNHIYTAGSDSKVRSWHVVLNNPKNGNILCYPENSSIQIEYCTTISLHNSVTVVRSHENYIIAGSIAGDICAYKEIGCKYEECTIRGMDGDGVTDICFVRKNVFVVAFESGQLTMYKLFENSNYEKNEKFEADGVDEECQITKSRKTDKILKINVESKHNEVQNIENNNLNEDKSKEIHRSENSNSNKQEIDKPEKTQIDQTENSQTIKNNDLEKNEIDESASKENIRINTTKKTKRKRIQIHKIHQLLQFKQLYNSSPHSLAIQGLAFSKKNNILCTFSKDKTAKFFLVSKKLTLLGKIQKIFADEQEIILFRKYCFSSNGDFLFIGGCNGFNMNILHKPFGNNCILGSIGPFEGHISVIYEFGNKNTLELEIYDENEVVNVKQIKEKWILLQNNIDEEITDENTNSFTMKNQKKSLNTGNINQFSDQENQITDKNTELQKITEKTVKNQKNVEQLLKKDENKLNQKNICDSNQITSIESQSSKNENNTLELINLQNNNDSIEQSGYEIKNIDNLVLFAVKNSLYCMNRSQIICKMENICYMGITDICMHKNIVFISSVDGLLSSVRFSPIDQNILQ